MVARRRTASTRSPSPQSNIEDQMAIDMPRSSPLHMGGGARTRSPSVEVDEASPESWESPVHYSDSSSTASWDDHSPPRQVSDVIHVPRSTRSRSDYMESQEPRLEREMDLTKSSSGSPSLFMVGLLFIGLVAAFLSRSSVAFAVQKASELSATRDKISKQLDRTEDDILALKRELVAMNALIHQQHGFNSNASPSDARKRLDTNELNSLQTHIRELDETGKDLKDRVQEISRNQILKKYGPGPKYVEMELVFPDGKGGPTKFTMELATQEMPHSSHTFLEMASNGLLDGCSFILNSMNVLKAAPLPYDGSLAAAKAKAFAAHGLESVAFKEYNPSYPHKKYTLGFAADGSPSFYINTEDNTNFHFGDPCFGRIVDGFETVKRLEAAPTRNGIWFAKKIGIKRAKILQSLPVSGLRTSGHSQE